MTEESLLGEAARAATPTPGFAERVIARLPKASTGRLVPPAPAPGERMRKALRLDAARRRRYLRLWGTAAAAALLFGSGTWAFGAWARSHVPLAEVVDVVGNPEAARTPWGRYLIIREGENLSPGTWVRTSDGALVRLRLPNGSLVDLGPGSRLRLETSRLAKLGDGRVWVSASKSQDPWLLETPEGTVRTLGTIFSVEISATPTGGEDTPMGKPESRRSP